MLEARGIHLRRGGRSILDGIDIAIRPGDCVALIGPNGAGKSSLLAVLSGEIRPDTGEARLDGRSLGHLSAATLAAERAFLEQSPSLSAPFRVADLVKLGLSAVRRVGLDESALTARAMRAVGIAALADRRADRLSGGERARAHLARVLAQLWAGRAAGGGRLLLLDEPTASLDLAHQVTVMEAARAEAQAGCAVIIVLHDLNLAALFADRAVLLDRGRLVADGPLGEVLRQDVLSHVYGTPIGVETARNGGLRISLDRARQDGLALPRSVVAPVMP
jgi:iron complex transport system ATP-binding protein